MTKTTKKHAGRPKKSPIDIIRTRAWFNMVQRMSGGLSPYKLELLFDGDKVKKIDGQPRRPRLWDKYRDGKHVPDKARIERVNDKYPGTAHFINHLLWKSLKHNYQSTDEINEDLFTLPNHIREPLFDPDRFEKKKRAYFTKEVLHYLIAVADMDSLSATILINKEANLIGSSELRDMSLTAYMYATEKLAMRKELFHIHPPLFDYIDYYFRSKVFPKPNQFMQPMIFWTGFRLTEWSNEARELSESLPKHNIDIHPNVNITTKTIL